jgi:hypothetical protein
MCNVPTAYFQYGIGLSHCLQCSWVPRRNCLVRTTSEASERDEAEARRFSSAWRMATISAASRSHQERLLDSATICVLHLWVNACIPNSRVVVHRDLDAPVITSVDNCIKARKTFFFPFYCYWVKVSTFWGVTITFRPRFASCRGVL